MAEEHASRFSAGVLVVVVPVWFHSGRMQDGKSNTLRISLGQKRVERDIWKSRFEGCPDKFRVKDPRLLLDPNSLDRWPTGEMSSLGNNFQMNDFQGSTSVGPRQFLIRTVCCD